MAEPWKTTSCIITFCHFLCVVSILCDTFCPSFVLFPSSVTRSVHPLFSSSSFSFVVCGLQVEKRRRQAAEAKRAEAALAETKKKIHALTGEPMDEDPAPSHSPEANGLANGAVSPPFRQNLIMIIGSMSFLARFCLWG